MDPDSKIEKHLNLNKNRMPENLHTTACQLVDYMDMAKMISDSIFGDDSTPELAIQIYDRLIQALQLKVEK